MPSIQRELVTYSDGGARGNPGPAGAGLVVRTSSGETLLEQGIFLGERTNNQAEYIALYKAIEKALEYAPTAVTCYLDSQLAVKQMSGEYKIKDSTLKDIVTKIHTMVGSLPVRYVHVPREQNKDADRLANVAMDRGTKSGDSYILVKKSI